MSADPIIAWIGMIRRQDAARIQDLVSEHAVLYSPLADAPQSGRAAVEGHLQAAIELARNGSFRYVREIVDTHDAALEFTATIDGVTVNGLHLVTWTESGHIIELKVMLRPATAAPPFERQCQALAACRP